MQSIESRFIVDFYVWSAFYISVGGEIDHVIYGHLVQLDPRTSEGWNVCHVFLKEGLVGVVIR